MRIRPVFLVPLSALLVTVCLGATAFGVQADFKDRFAGQWEADKEKTKKYTSEHEDGAKFPDEALDAMPSMTLEFLPSGMARVSMRIPGIDDVQTMEGDWKIVEEIDADHAKLKIMMKDEEKEDTKEAKAEFLDDDTLAITIHEEPTLVFTRSDDDNKKKDDKTADEKDKLPVD